MGDLDDSSLSVGRLSRPFSELLDAEGITNTYIRRWLDMICFLLQGATTSEAPTTLMAYTTHTPSASTLFQERVAVFFNARFSPGVCVCGRRSCEQRRERERPSLETTCYACARSYMLSDFYRDGVCLDFPRGGTGAIVDALQRGLEKKGGTLHLKAPVEQIVEEGGRAAGVRASATAPALTRALSGRSSSFQKRVETRVDTLGD